MKNINTFFKEIFDTKEIPDGGLLHFAYDHIERLKKNNIGGKYDRLITDTQFLFHQFLEIYYHKTEIKSVKINKTHEVDVMLEHVKNAIRKLAAYIQAYHEKDSEIYTCFFPEGLSEYSRINKANINTLIYRISSAAEKYKEEVDNQILDSILKAQHLYQSKRNQQLTDKRTFKENVEKKRKLRKQLARQLQINLYELAIEYIGDSGKEILFFDSELLGRKVFKPETNLKENYESRESEKISGLLVKTRG